MCRGWRRISIITTVLRPSDAKLSERIQSRVHAGGAIAMLTRMALFTLVTLMTACGTSGYADIPIEEKPTRATAAQQERYGVAEETLVLLELLPSSYKHDIGPAGASTIAPTSSSSIARGPSRCRRIMSTGGSYGLSIRAMPNGRSARPADVRADFATSHRVETKSGSASSRARMTTGASLWWLLTLTDH